MAFDGPLPGIDDATVREAALSPLADAQAVGPFTWAKPRALQFEVPHIARYRIEDGRTITVEALPGADPRAVSLFLQGSARAVLIHQRGELALDATVVQSPKGLCIAIASFSGVGKSTVAAELCRYGWTLLSDDIARIAGASPPMVHPGAAKLALWRDACERLGYDVAENSRVRAGLDKYFVDVRSSGSTAPLAAVVKLRVTPAANFGELMPEQRAATIAEHIFRPAQLAALGLAEGHRSLLLQVAEAVPVFHALGAQLRPVEEIAGHISRRFA